MDRSRPEPIPYNAEVARRWENNKTPDGWLVSNTSELPVDVVGSPLYVWAAWIPTDGVRRQTTQAYALQIGDEVNPTPTPDQADRIVGRLLDLAGVIWRDYGDDRELL